MDPPEASDDELDRMLEAELESPVSNSPTGSITQALLEDYQEAKQVVAALPEDRHEANPSELDHMQVLLLNEAFPYRVKTLFRI